MKRDCTLWKIWFGLVCLLGKVSFWVCWACSCESLSLVLFGLSRPRRSLIDRVRCTPLPYFQRGVIKWGKGSLFKYLVQPRRLFKYFWVKSNFEVYLNLNRCKYIGISAARRVYFYETGLACFLTKLHLSNNISQYQNTLYLNSRGLITTFLYQTLFSSFIFTFLYSSTP